MVPRTVFQKVTRESSSVTRDGVRIDKLSNFNHGIQYFLDLAREDYRRNNWYSVFVGTLEFPLNSSILQTRKREYNAFIKVEKKRKYE